MKAQRVVLTLCALLAIFGMLPAAAQAAQPAAPAPTAHAAYFIYYVLPGDTLAKLAARFGTTVWSIWHANPSIKDPNRIYAGQRLVIPAAGPITTVKVALIDVGGGGGVGCGDSVVLINRQIAATNAPLTAAMRELLAIKQQHYGESGLYDALYQANLNIQSVTIASGKAVIRLTGSLNLGGECDDPRALAQFERTATQFSTVNSAEIYVNGVLLQTLLSGK